MTPPPGGEASGGEWPGDEHEAARVASARAGDEHAFAQLVRRHQDQLYRVALRMTGDPDDAQEVVQETFVQAWQHLPSFRGDARFATWTTRILINRCHNLQRARRPSSPLPSPAEQTPGSLQSPAADTLAVGRERRAAVHRALLALPIEQRAPLVLHTFGGHTYADIGRILGISETNAKVRAHRGRRVLSEGLRGWR